MTKAAAIAAEIPRLRRYARALIGDAAAADDLVQECLVRALANQSQWREEVSPRKWLFAILHNVHIDEARRRTRRPAQVQLEAAETESQPADGQGGAAMFEIEDALAELPEEQRQALLNVVCS
jgi:RNA polymerase sigma-70 factor (ECF subfamily)